MGQTYDGLFLTADPALLLAVAVRAVCFFHICLSALDTDHIVKFSFSNFDRLIFLQRISSIDFPVHGNLYLIPLRLSGYMHHQKHYQSHQHDPSCQQDISFFHICSLSVIFEKRRSYSPSHRQIPSRISARRIVNQNSFPLSFRIPQ